MDPTEEHVREYLVLNGYSDIRYEPDGKVPPDFLVDGCIAVEARRLNQRDCDGLRGLEETRIPVQMRLARLIRSASSDSNDKKWIDIDMSRPLPDWDDVESEVVRFLKRIDAGACPVGSVVAVGNLRLVYRSRTRSDAGVFVPASLHDEDWGGFVVAEQIRSLSLCIKEKSRKTSSYRGRYPTWWLAFVDTIGYRLSQYDRMQLRRAFDLEHDWGKIILINPLDASDHLDL